MRADLHMHSYYSDGSESPAEVVRQAAAGGLDLIALTDHDTLGGWEEAEAAGRELGVRVLPSAEFTASLHGQEIHLLGYFHEPPGHGVRAHLERIQTFRRNRIETAIERLQRKGMAVSLEELPCEPCCQSLTAAHLGQLLLEKGYATSRRALWRRSWLRAALPSFSVTPAEVIEVIHAGGGLAVWAHPAQKRFRRRLEELLAVGLDGVEAANFRRGLESARQLQAEAQKLGLVVTGGSDWHGEGKLGEFAADGELLADFFERLDGGPPFSP